MCCASVSSAVMMAANTVTEVIGAEARVDVNEGDGSIELRLTERDKLSEAVLEGLRLHMELISEEFPGRISLELR